MRLSEFQSTVGRVDYSVVTGAAPLCHGDEDAPGDPVPSLPLHHFSPSSLTMLQTCPRQFQQRYIKGLKQRPTGALALGKAVHLTLEHGFKHKIKTQEDIGLVSVGEFYHDEAWPSMLDEFGGPSEIVWDSDPKDSRFLGEQMASRYLHTVGPRVEPLETEFEFWVPFAGVPIPVHGYIDLLQKDNRPFIDWKTSKQAVRKVKPDWRIQGRIYMYVMSRDMDWHVITKTRESACYTSLDCPDLLQKYSPEMNEGTARIVKDLYDLFVYYLDKYGPDDDWPALGIGHQWKCGKWCGYSNTCPAWRGT